MSPGADCAALFAGRAPLRAVIDGVLEGHLGHGDPASTGARGLVAGARRPKELVYGNSPAWRRLILEVHGGEVTDRPMLDFDPAACEVLYLRLP